MSLYSNIDQSRYKLLELTPDLLSYVTQNDNPTYAPSSCTNLMFLLLTKDPESRLKLMAPEPTSDLVLCTETKTYKVRELHHSNSLFAMDASTDQIQLLSNINTIWETQEIASQGASAAGEDKSELLDNVPRYYGAHEHSFGSEKAANGAGAGAGLRRKRPESARLVRTRIPVSEAEFQELWRRHAGVEFNTAADGDGEPEAYLASDDVICQVLKDVLVVLKSVPATTLGSVDPKAVYKCLVEDEEYDEPFQVVDSVLRKFASAGTARKFDFPFTGALRLTNEL